MTDRPDAKLQAAIAEFRDALTPQQRGQLQAYQTTPEPDAIIKLTAEVDAQQAHYQEKCVGTRLHSILESICEFSGVVDTFVSTNPGIAALIWGSVKFSVLVMSMSVWA